jgi:hypothetical protein
MAFTARLAAVDLALISSGLIRKPLTDARLLSRPRQQQE